MLSNLFTYSKLAVCTLAIAGFTSSCNKDDDSPAPKTTNLRTAIDYSVLTPTTPYTSLFVDANGDTTVDRNEGRDLLNILKSIDTYGKSGTTAEIDSAYISNLFSGISNYTATSLAQADKDKFKSQLESYFGHLASASKLYDQTASDGQAGILTNNTSKYLVDANAIEWIQVISKSLIGGFQYDYIGNVLLTEGLKADNSKLVAGKKYTALEHNWDVAYGIFTKSDIYAVNATDAVKDANESFLGAYVWEYNKEGYKKMHAAFLKGRAAIVNNDLTVVVQQANIIKKEIEKAIASSSLGYLTKTKNGLTTGAGAHAFGEGLGFINSLRFCKKHNANVAFADGVYNPLINKGFWDLVVADLVTAETAIKTQFGL